MIFLELSDAVKQRILGLCTQRQITINKLSIICGITQSSLNNIVNGASLDPKISTIKKVCDGLEITLAQFFDCDEFNSLEQELK